MDIHISTQDTILGQFWFAVIDDVFDVLDNGLIIGQGFGKSRNDAIENLYENLETFCPELLEKNWMIHQYSDSPEPPSLSLREIDDIRLQLIVDQDELGRKKVISLLPEEFLY